MFPDSPFAEPLSSFQFPVDPLTVEPDAAPLETIQVNSAWLELLRGCAKQLLLQSTWRTEDPAVLDLAQGRAFNLIDLLQDQGAPTVTLPTGSIVTYGADAAPDGWLVCDGASLLRADYADLFDVIGTTFGSVDGTHFSLPDLRGRAAIGTGQGAGLTDRDLAATGGEETHTLSVGELAAHHHQELALVARVPYAMFYPQNTGSTGLSTINSDTLTGSNNLPLDTADTGSGTAHNTMMPFLALTCIIKV